ncbi:MAG: glycoside hydrolase family 10 protein, partial [Microcystaceae cyanobacterium]
AVSVNPSSEIRGVWLTNIDSEVLFDAQTLSNSIDTLNRLNFNTVYPTVWNWGYTLYPSQVAEKVIGKKIDPTEGLQERDMLKEIITDSHQKNMAVIPWFEFGFMAPSDSELAKRHPDWLTKRENGDTIWWEGKVHQRVWLNPFHPEVQQLITDLVIEIVSNYDVDGIQFDDHFGYPADFGYDDYTIALYQKEHNGKAPPKLNGQLNTGQNCRVNRPGWKEWTEWRSQKITNYMKDLFTEIKKANPKALVSVSPNPQTFSKNCYLLDWQKWERMGLIEELIVQVYRNNMNSFQRELNQPAIKTAKTHIPVAIGVLSGLKGRPTPLSLIENQVNYTRQQNYAGVSFFFYESLWNFGKESKMERQTAIQSWFSRPTTRASVL